MEIKDKKAVVFGGASGTGRAPAEPPATPGENVSVLD